VFDVRAAGPNELDDVLGVLDDAAAWLQVIGMTEQWPASFSAEPAWVERFTRWTAEGRVFIARDANGVAVGCFRLLDADDHIWTNESGSALYLHSLAVVRRAAGQDVAKAMLDWAVAFAARRGIEELRLDCWAGNERLKRYYVDAGFDPRGEAMVASEPDGENDHKDYYVAKFAKKVL